MNDQVGYPMPEDASPERSVVAETGNTAVDEVLRSLDALDGSPVEEHVGVFESAHERLRAALARAAGPHDRPGQGQR